MVTADWPAVSFAAFSVTRALWILLSIVIALVCFTVAGWLMYRWLKRSEDDPGRLISKWVISAVIIGGTVYVVRGTGGGMEAAFIIPVAGAVCGVVLAIVWGQNIGAWVAKPFEGFFTGGGTPPEPTPFYSIAQARRQQGRFREAVYEIQNQLARFPLDVTGQMLLAEIQAEHLNDLPAAQMTIERLCHQPGHTPRNLANALSQLADWHLKLSQDTEAARQALERIIALLPDTEQAQQAAQRLARLSDAGSVAAVRDRAPIPLHAGVDNVGLLANSSALLEPDADPAVKAAEYVKHLEQHPLDSETREKLALIYAEHYQRMDLATAELEQLIQQPHQPARQVVHGLNLLADLQIKHTPDYEPVRATLQRIVDLDPNLAAAEHARQRIAHLKLEFKAKEKSQTVQLGEYEQDIGLKPRRTENEGLADPTPTDNDQ